MFAEVGPDYEWKLRELMALKGLWHTSQLVEPLAKRGIELSRTQVYRFESQRPGRVTIPLLVALCDILECKFEDLMVPRKAAAVRAPRRRKATRAKAVNETQLADPVPTEFFEDL